MSRWMRWMKSATTPLVSLTRRLVRRENLMTAVCLLVVGAGAFFIGRTIGLPKGGAVDQIKPPSGNDPRYSDDYNGRVVAYIYNKEPISRVALAEFLIERFGQERLEFLVNRMVIERACRAVGVMVNDVEIERQFSDDLRNLGPHMDAATFQKQVLKPYNKTIFEWKEDVIRPKLMMIKFVQATCKITVDPLEMTRGYEARYGEMVNCRMIVFQNENDAQKTWQQISLNPNREAAFLENASKQFVPQLAAKAGEVPPIHRHFGDPRIEKAAFSMKTGEISQVFGMPDGTSVILLCQGRRPADPRPIDHKEIYGPLLKELSDFKLAQTIQSEMLRLRREANAQFLLGRQTPISQVYRDAEKSISEPVDFRGFDPKK